MSTDLQVLVECFLPLFEIFSRFSSLLLLFINLLRSLLQFILKYGAYVPSMIIEILRSRLLDGVDAPHNGAVAVQNVVLFALSQRVTGGGGHAGSHHVSAHGVAVHVEWVRAPVLDLSSDILNSMPVLLLSHNIPILLLL